MDLYNVFVLCGGKCGGTTLATTFARNNFSVTHLHSLTTKGMFFSEIDANNTIEVLEKSCEKYENVYIIDVYRTPIERKISSFFQNISSHLSCYDKLCISEIISFFNDRLLSEIENYHPIDEILNQYNIPLFNNFDFEKKYNIVKKDNKIFIKLLFKDIDEWSNILSTIFNKNIVIHNNNLTKYKPIYNLYKQFNENYRVPQGYINDYIINDNAFKIYNTKEEQIKYINVWSKKLYSTIFPKNIWFYWDDLKSIPREFLDNIKLYEKNYPDFKVEIIIDDNINLIPELNNTFPGLLFLYNKLNNYAAKSDVARLIYLYFYGGIYVDTHVEHIFKANCNNIYTLYDKYKNYDCSIARNKKGVFNCTTLISKPYCNLLYYALCDITKKLEKHYELENKTDEYIKYNVLCLTGSSVFFLILKFYELKHIIEPDDITNSVNFKKYNTACFCCSDYFNYYKVNYNYNHGNSNHWSEQQKTKRLFIEK